MTYFHPEEESQFGVLSVYDDEHPGTRYLIEFPDGESYICRYFTDYESENSGDLDIDADEGRRQRRAGRAGGSRFSQLPAGYQEQWRT
jgi:hypothetical protein